MRQVFVISLLCALFSLNTTAQVTIPNNVLVSGAAYQSWLLQQTDQTLYQLALAKKVGSCRVIDARTCQQNGGCACSYYVVNTKTGWNGWVGSLAGAGTKGMPGIDTYGSTGCGPSCYARSLYSGAMCSGDAQSRMGAQVRWGLTATAAQAGFAANGDPCDLNNFVATLATKQAVDLRQYVINGNIVFDPSNVTRCLIKAGTIGSGANVNNQPQLLSPSVCRQLANMGTTGAVTGGSALAPATQEQLSAAAANTNEAINLQADTAYIATQISPATEQQYYTTLTSVATINTSGINGIQSGTTSTSPTTQPVTATSPTSAVAAPSTSTAPMQ